MDRSENSVQHLSVFLRKLKERESFALIRPGDGEYLIMQNETFHTQDEWDFKGGSLQKDLLNVKESIEGLPNFYVGVPCSGCHGDKIIGWYQATWGFTDEQMTYASVLCNKNWKPFTNYLIQSKHPLYYIGPGTKIDTPLNIKQRFFTDTTLVNTWDTDKVSFLMNLSKWVATILAYNHDVCTFVFSVGPISKIVIPYLHRLYPNNQFIDVGSSLDYYTKESSNRYYIRENDIHSHTVCDFTKGHDQGNDITVILNFYKRPHVLVEQIAAIRGQNVPPTQIIIWKNYAEGYEIPEEVRKDDSIIIMDSNRNMGVWARFAAGLLANTEFVCVFDDDTIPGCRWFENCLNTMKKVNGLLGTIGIRFHKDSEKYNSFAPRIGWDGPIYEVEEVDMVCHSWFFRREWLPELFKIVPDYKMMFRAGEDMGLSYAFQQIGVKTYVPPHPPYDYDLYGSLPDLAKKYGTENVAISMGQTNFDEMFLFYKKKGFSFLRDRV